MRIRLLSDWFCQRLIIAFRFPKREYRLGKVSIYLAPGSRYILKKKTNISSIEPQNTDDQTLLSFSDDGKNWSQFLPLTTKLTAWTKRWGYFGLRYLILCGLELVVAFPFTLLMVVFFPSLLWYYHDDDLSYSFGRRLRMPWPAPPQGRWNYVWGGDSWENRPLRIEDNLFLQKALRLLLDLPYCLTFQRLCSVFRAIGAPMHLHYIQSYIVDVATRRQRRRGT